ncbi:alpha/beta fold hydrolase [Myceligenerans pegani]|uniref:Alpha/beta fold hydrolase n=1 Tax=Myceligenerans pegani TaxID=2776917 RepID=A0ABR9N343_9MICO|nr:alpha/beta hydrolase [Myceligenerans sp. TRM 65318]MBE1878069.1 alpha/beta fold hydrolase [Myceligenerans sp. TRM 65318]MBE3020340.1 alpha/beta fold hydrolase [Myceligenerans sp. TRM 65318]
MPITIPELEYRRVTVADDVALHVGVGGEGSPVVLLHGFPQTHLMWRRVVPDLARDHTVIVPDLRGYGDSDKPAADSPAVYSKRTMAADVVALADALGHERFALAGHDRGALVAVRAGLDHPDRVTHLAVLDVLPVPDMWDVLHGADAAVAFHLYLMAQPPGLPEKMIAATGDEFFGHFLDAWDAGGTTIPADVRSEYLRASRQAVPSIVADYRASAGIDLDHDLADRAAGRRLGMPVSVVQQDWGAVLGYDAARLWSAWAEDLDHRTLDAGHFMAEQAPERIAGVLRELLER